ncbi:MAG: hypothetical protein WBQ95_16415, partial [Terracidiphilus sp.]
SNDQRNGARRLSVVLKPLDQFPLLFGLRVVLLAAPIGPTMAAAAEECCFSLRYINATDSPSTATGEPVSGPAEVGFGRAEVDYLTDPSVSEVLARDCDSALACAVCHDYTGYGGKHRAGEIVTK